MAWLTDTELEEALDKITFHKTDGSSLSRPMKAAIHLASMHDIGQEHDQKLAARQKQFEAIAQAGNSGPMTQNHQAILKRRALLTQRMDAILRSMYHFANVLFQSVNAEALRVEGEYDVSMHTLANDHPGVFDAIDASAARAAYCVSQFRNAFVSHHTEPPPLYGSQLDPDGSFRLVLVGPSFFNISADDDAQLQALWGSWGDTTTRPDEENRLERLRLLFDAVSVRDDNGIAQDRKSINRLARRYPVTSLSIDELWQAARRYIIALAVVVDE